MMANIALNLHAKKASEQMEHLKKTSNDIKMLKKLNPIIDELEDKITKIEDNNISKLYQANDWIKLEPYLDKLKKKYLNQESDEEEKPKPKRGRPKRSQSPTTITHEFDEKSSKVKKTKKQMLLEAKEEKDKQNREDLAKEANDKQLMFMKKFHPEQYEALMNVKKEEPKPKKINIKRGNKAKMENERAIKDRELELEKEHYKLLKTQDKLRIEKDVGEIMKGKSELIKKGKKMSVETELDIKKGLQKKVKNALRKSIIDEIDKKLIGSGLSHKYHIIYGQGVEDMTVNRAKEYFEYVKNRFGKI